MAPIARPSALALALCVCAVVAAAAAPSAAPAESAAAAAAAAPAMACVLTLPVQAKQSPFTLVGSVSKPFNATVTPIKAAASGFVYLRLPAGAAASSARPCPAPEVWRDPAAAAELLAAAALVQPVGKPGVGLVPARLNASVIAADGGDRLATYTLADFSFGLEGNGPLGGGGGATDAEVVVLKGGLVIDSPLTGERTATLRNVAQNVTFSASSAAAAAAAAAAPGLGVTLRGVRWSLAVGPDTTPGIMFTEAKVGIEGDLVASAADLAKAAAAVPASSLRLRCSPRVLGPVIEGGEEAKADLVKRQKRVSGGCPDGAAAGAKAAAKQVAGAGEPAAGGEAEAGSGGGGGGGGGGLSEVDKAVKAAYGNGSAAAASAGAAGALMMLAAALMAA